jgi:hypothetical protein
MSIPISMRFFTVGLEHFIKTLLQLNSLALYRHQANVKF